VTNAYRIEVGDMVSYLTPLVVGPPEIQPRWRSVKVTAITDQNNLVLAYVDFDDGTLTPINGGVAVPRRSSPPAGDTETNVWRPY
jgi:hypothetical protein